MLYWLHSKRLCQEELHKRLEGGVCTGIGVNTCVKDHSEWSESTVKCISPSNTSMLELMVDDGLATGFQ